MATTSTRTTVLAVLGALLGLAAFMGVVYVGCSQFLKSNPAYDEAVALALADPLVGETLGAPVREGFFINGEVQSDGMDAWASYLVRLNGTQRAGTLRIRGYKGGGDWQVTEMTLEADGDRLYYVPGAGFTHKAPPRTAPPPPPPVSSP